MTNKLHKDAYINSLAEAVHEGKLPSCYVHDDLFGFLADQWGSYTPWNETKAQEWAKEILKDEAAMRQVDYFDAHFNVKAVMTESVREGIEATARGDEY